MIRLSKSLDNRFIERGHNTFYTLISSKLIVELKHTTWFIVESKDL